MSYMLDKPETGKLKESGGLDGRTADVSLRYGLASMQGWREDMEDSHTATTGLDQLPGPSLPIESIEKMF